MRQKSGTVTVLPGITVAVLFLIREKHPQFLFYHNDDSVSIIKVRAVYYQGINGFDKRHPSVYNVAEKTTVWEKKMRIAIIEDCAIEAELLKRKTEMFAPLSFQPVEIDIFKSGEDFLSTGNNYELFFIDCLLPGITGVELAKRIRETNDVAAFVFVTANIEYATDGYEVNAIRYLLKPVLDDKLKEAFLCYEKLAAIDPIVELTGTKRHPVYAKISQIIYIESAEREVVVRLAEKAISSQKTVRDFERIVQDGFFCRTQRGFLVNLQQIVQKDGDTLIMSTGEKVSISRRKKKIFNEKYLDYLRY